MSDATEITTEKIETLPAGLKVEAKAEEVDPMDSDRGEEALYQNAKDDEPVLLPITRRGYQALMKRACDSFSPPLPYDQSVDGVFHGFVHHIDKTVPTTTIKALAECIYKSMANHTTWVLDQELKIARQQAVEEVQRKQKLEAEKAKMAQAIAKRDQKAGKKSGVKSNAPKMSA